MIFIVMLKCAQGMLGMRNLETMKRTSSAAKLAARSDPSKKTKPAKIPKTGLFAPEQLGSIAAVLKASKAEFEHKRPHICQVPKCNKRYVYRSGLEAHMKSEHPCVPLPSITSVLSQQLPNLQAKLQEVIALERIALARANLHPVAAAVSDTYDDENSDGRVVDAAAAASP